MPFDDEPLVTLTLGSPSMIPSAFADVVGAIANLETRTEIGMNVQNEIIDQILEELTEEQMDLVERIAALVAVHQAATNYQTFAEWLGSDGRRIAMLNPITHLMENDRNWPRDAHACADIRAYVIANHPQAADLFGQAWGHYWALSISKYGDAETTTIESQHAVSIGWPDGSNEIHPKTVDGVSRYEADRHANTYNDIEISSMRRTARNPEALSSATVVRRTVVYGPWYVA